jgi:hypothetical protein
MIKYILLVIDASANRQAGKGRQYRGSEKIGVFLAKTKGGLIK